MSIKNPYTANKAEPGDVFVRVVTCHILEGGYRLYTCDWPPQEFEGVPQGNRMYSLLDGPLDGVVRHLFSVVSNLGIKEDH